MQVKGGLAFHYINLILYYGRHDQAPIFLEHSDLLSVYHHKTKTPASLYTMQSPVDKLAVTTSLCFIYMFLIISISAEALATAHRRVH